jgi:hypothetical protein
MRGDRHLAASLGLLFRLMSDGVVETVPGVAMQEFEGSLDLADLVAHIDEIAIVRNQLACFLQHRVQVAHGSVQRRDALHETIVVCSIGSRLPFFFELFDAVAELVDMALKGLGAIPERL